MDSNLKKYLNLEKIAKIISFNNTFKKNFKKEGKSIIL